MSSETTRPASSFPSGAFVPEPGGAGFLDPPAPVRFGLLAYAGFLAIGGLWLTLSALLLPQAIALPLDKASAAAAASHRSSALWAARLGAIRGDLFAQAAFADGDLVWLNRASGLDAADAGRLERARSNIETALALAPVNGGGWLYLSQLAPPPAKGAETAAVVALQMSYLTAPNDPALARARLERALSLATPIDRDLQEFMKGDIRQMVDAQPEQKVAIVAAYKAATPQNRLIFETIAAGADPEFSRSLAGGEPPK